MWGNVLAEITAIHQAETETKRTKMEFLQNIAQFVNRHDLPTSLRTKIIKWARVKAEVRSSTEGTRDMIDKLPPDLQNSLVSHLYSKEVSTVPIFRYLQAETGDAPLVQKKVKSVKFFLSEVYAHLEYKMYMPGELLVDFSSAADRLLFFINSVVEVEFEHPTIERPNITLRGSYYVGKRPSTSAVSFSACIHIRLTRH